MVTRGRSLALAATLLVVAACSSSGSSTAVPTYAGSPPIAGGLLDKVVKAGKVVVSTDPNYEPQSFQNPDGTYAGFDIDVATEVAHRIGVSIEFVTPDWSAITAGGWGGRWDMSVGSMTITSEREAVLDFSPPYYYTPAQFAASKASGISTIDGLAHKRICAGQSTTYLEWLTGGKLDFGAMSPTASPPSGVEAVSQKTDADCAQLWAAGRNDFEGWLTGGPTVDAAIAAGQPLVKVGDPVYFEPLGIAVDKRGPNDSDFMARLNDALTGMHNDGTLTKLSMKWYKTDLTKGPFK